MSAQEVIASSLMRLVRLMGLSNTFDVTYYQCSCGTAMTDDDEVGRHAKLGHTITARTATFQYQVTPK